MPVVKLPEVVSVKLMVLFPVAKTMSPAVRKELGIGENLLRLSVGLEDVEDLKDDLTRTLKRT